MDRSTKRSITRMLTVLFVVVVVISLLSVAAQWEIEAEEMSERDYCARVLAKTHTHFNKRVDCRKWWK